MLRRLWSLKRTEERYERCSIEVVCNCIGHWGVKFYKDRYQPKRHTLQDAKDTGTFSSNAFTRLSATGELVVPQALKMVSLRPISGIRSVMHIASPLPENESKFRS
tara:strand:- start:14495 stop:14812 length:318 start_codon:yes stop_codon:yes gene_type:complete